MHLPRYVAPVAASLAAMALLVSSACGILTAPFTVPAAIDANAFFNFSATLTDPTGTPLDNVTLHQTLNHTFWHPTEIQTTTNEPKIRQFNHTVSVNERGAHLSLIFSKEGYYDAQFDLFARSPGIIHTLAGDMPVKSNFPVILYPVTPADSDLRSWRGYLPYGNYPKPVLDLTKLAGTSAGAAISPLLSLNDISTASPGSFYLNFSPAETSAKPSAAESVTINITDGQLQLMTTRPYEDPLLSSDTAPDAGYQPQLILDQARLKEMRSNTVSSHEYFFFRTQNHFGKGYIVPFGNTFNANIWINPIAGDHNLITHKPVRR
ncbi:MAG TPA: hypothetical protein VGN88_08445 [Phycisphaerae bacterium]|jgi:hypothetical protein